MSETQEEVSVPEDEAPPSMMPLARFADLLRPRVVENYPNGRPKRYSAGEPDALWLKVLEVHHKGERHTEAEWRGLIEKHKERPAHPADLKFKRERG